MGVSWRPTNFRYLIQQDSDRGHVVGTGGVATLGGIVSRYIASGNINLGDVVCLVSGSDYTVIKSTNAAVHRGVVGIAVGGIRLGGITDYEVLTEKTQYNSLQVAANGEGVLIQTTGQVFAILAGAYAVGTVLIPDTGVAGRLQSAADLAVGAGATPVTSTAANGAIMTGVSGRLVGKLIAASSGANDVQAIQLFIGG